MVRYGALGCAEVSCGSITVTAGVTVVCGAVRCGTARLAAGKGGGKGTSGSRACQAILQNHNNNQEGGQ